MNLDMALVLREVPDVSRYGQAVLDGAGRLTGFNEKTTEARPGTINGGIYLMKRGLLEDIPEGKVSLENEMIDLSNELAVTQPGDRVSIDYMTSDTGICIATGFDNLAFTQKAEDGE